MKAYFALSIGIFSIVSFSPLAHAELIPGIPDFPMHWHPGPAPCFLPDPQNPQFLIPCQDAEKRSNLGQEPLSQ